jgi:hypothetical protein
MTTQTADQAIQPIIEALRFYAATESYASASSIPDVMRDLGRRAKEALAAGDRSQVGATRETINARPFTIYICNDCYLLKGEMCHEPDCVFCRRTMDEVGDALDMLHIRPVVDSERFDLHPVDPAATEEASK